MSPFTITIDGQPVQVSAGQTVLQAARALGLDIPGLCYLEKCGPLTSCLVCLVKIDGKLVPSCDTRVRPGMVVESETEEVRQARRTALELLFSDHVGDCLSPCQRLCPLGLNIPVMLRQVQAGQLAQASVTLRGALPLAGVLGRLCHHPCEQGCRRGAWDDPAAIRDIERFVAECDLDFGRKARNQPATGKTVAIIGAGPAGLAAACYLACHGHSVTVLDRQSRAGGSLRHVPETELPASVLDAEIAWLADLGIAFKLGVELGNSVTVEGLSREHSVLLLTVGKLAPGEGERMGVPLAGQALKADPNTCQTPLPKVFAAGTAVKPVKHLVRAMVEGRAAAECVHQFLKDEPVRRPEKPFSSVMGRLKPGELRQFLAASASPGAPARADRAIDAGARAVPREPCAGLNRAEAATEAARCLHCDCRSSGNCLLQHYAQIYGAEPKRFQAERRPFEQQAQPEGVIFEPGKCILCGICVKLTELAREPLALTFIGRGFDVHVGAPLNHRIAEGLQKVAEECVTHCPTGALAF